MSGPQAAYNVFRHKRQPDLRCAVRQDRPVPAFVNGEVWDFDGTVGATEAGTLGFRPDGAAEATRLTGYYLFHDLGA